MSHPESRHGRTRVRRGRWLTFRSKRRHLSKVEAVVATVLVMAAVITFVMVHRQERTASIAVEVLPAGGDIRLATSTFENGQAHFYQYSTRRGEVRFFVIKTADGKVRAAFDACELCHTERRGYRQTRQMMVCNYCGRTSPVTEIDTVRARRDCNPVPIEAAVEGEQVLLKAISLLEGSRYF